MNKLVLFDFKCKNGHVFEELVEKKTHATRCSCGLKAKRTISPIKSQLEGISGDFPDASDRWVKNRESHIKYERKISS
tara:strand:+ start:26592 stop:26825 length:234 start_codon:yes stop_codon:yes gene_type:complete